MIRPEVYAGAAFLDEQCPSWLSLIDLDKLNMKDTCACVLGQTLGWLAVDNLPGAYDDDGYWNANVAGEYGFDNLVIGGYATLEAEWRELILSRLSAAGEGADADA